MANGPTFKLAGSGPMIGGTYDAHGSNADGSSYTGTVVIKVEGSVYRFSWLISDGSNFHGTGRFSNNKIVVNWGQKYPVIYEIGAEGVLNGTWNNGRASETLIPRP
jgi:hypothetical protein